MRRRRFLLLALTALVPPTVAANAAVADPPVVGFLSSASPGPFASLLQSFREGLAEQDFHEGSNVVIVYRFANGDYGRLPTLARELVELGVDVLLSSGGDRPTLAAMAATDRLPIVFAGSDAPVALGLVESLGRPGGNVTGASLFTSEVEVKKLELLHEVVPDAVRIAMLINPRNPTASTDAAAMAAAAAEMRLQLQPLAALDDDGIDAAFEQLAGDPPQALLVGHDPFFNNARQSIIAHVEALGIPAVYEHRAFVLDGGLMSYGNVIEDNYRIAGNYVGRILRGESPAHLPVRQPTTFELVVNLGSARALGISFPLSVLVRADTIVE